MGISQILLNKELSRSVSRRLKRAQNTQVEGRGERIEGRGGAYSSAHWAKRCMEPYPDCG